MAMENTQGDIISGSKVQAKAVNTHRAESSKAQRSRRAQAKETVSPAVMIQVIQQALENGKQAGIKIESWESKRAVINSPVVVIAIYGYGICGICHEFYSGEHTCANTVKDTDNDKP